MRNLKTLELILAYANLILNNCPVPSLLDLYTYIILLVTLLERTICMLIKPIIFKVKYLIFRSLQMISTSQTNKHRIPLSSLTVCLNSLYRICTSSTWAAAPLPGWLQRQSAFDACWLWRVVTWDSDSWGWLARSENVNVSLYMVISEAGAAASKREWMVVSLASSRSCILLVGIC